MPPPTVVVPPWLNIDPVAPVGRYLEGYGLGQRSGIAQTEAIARQQQQALAQQQAAELNAYRQQQQALDAEQFNAKLRLDQEKAQREAAAAASQLEAQQGIQDMMSKGATWPQALAQWGGKLFAGEPRGYATAMHQMAPPNPPVFGETPEGVPYIQGPGGGVSVVPRAYTRGEHVPKTDVFGGVEYIESSPGHWQPLRQPQEQTLTQAGRARLSELTRDEANIYRQYKGMTEAEIAEESPTTAKKLSEIDAERQSIYGGQWKPGTPAATQQQNDPKILLQKANEKIERIRKGIPAGPAQDAAINQVVAKLRALGINMNMTQPTSPTQKPISVNPYDSGLGGF